MELHSALSSYSARHMLEEVLQLAVCVCACTLCMVAKLVLEGISTKNEIIHAVSQGTVKCSFLVTHTLGVLLS